MGGASSGAALGAGGNSEEIEASPAGSAEGSEHVRDLLESQKKVYEVGRAHSLLRLFTLLVQ